MSQTPRDFNVLQKISMSLMGVLVLITFIGANLQALLWQSSDWLVSTVLPAVVVDLTNEERLDNSGQPLQRNSTLDAAAKLKAEHMAQNEYFSHFSPTGVSPWHWFDEAGYVYAHAGENLAIHFTDSSEVVEAWMKSPTHRQNIVNGLYTEIGVGTAKGEYEGFDTVYVVQLFGTPAVVPVKNAGPLAVATTKSTPTAVVESVSNILYEPEVELVEVYPEVVVAATQPDESPTPAETSVPVAVLSEVESVSVSEPEVVEQIIPETEVAVSETITTIPADIVVIESLVIATSSGLAVAQITNSPAGHAGATLPSLITQPNTLLQIVYGMFAIVIVTLLGASIVIEARRLRFQQVAYGLFLLFGMGGLWFVHSVLTTGAVVV